MTASQDNETAFLMEFNKARDDIFAYIFSLVSSYAEAEDVFQEVSIVLWQKFGEFRPGTRFSAWARKIAWYKVQQARTKHAKELPWDPSELEALDAAFEAEEEDKGSMQDVMSALERCLQKLSVQHRLIVERRYGQEMTYGDIARMFNRSQQGLKVLLHRIRQKLADCVDRESAVAAKM